MVLAVYPESKCENSVNGMGCWGEGVYRYNGNGKIVEMVKIVKVVKMGRIDMVWAVYPE